MGVKLEANTERENQARGDNTPFTAKGVSKWRSEKSAKECASRKDGDLEEDGYIGIVYIKRVYAQPNFCRSLEYTI